MENLILWGENKTTRTFNAEDQNVTVRDFRKAAVV